MKPQYRSVLFDDDKKQLTILDTNTSIPYADIDKVSVLNEDAAFKGKTKPFSHQVLGGTAFYSLLGEPRLYVGLRILRKDGTIEAAYISGRKTGFNTNIYLEDTREGEAIKAAIDSRIA